jgi:acyl carrier protein
VDRDQIAERIRRYLADTYPAETAELDLESELSESVLVDSLSVVTTVAFLEDAFSIRVRRADLNNQNFRNVRTLSEFVASQLGG